MQFVEEVTNGLGADACIEGRDHHKSGLSKGAASAAPIFLCKKAHQRWWGKGEICLIVEKYRFVAKIRLSKQFFLTI